MHDVPVTLVIPNHNGARFLRETIRSLLGQTLRDFRLILLDDQSTDDSVEIAETFSDPRFRIVQSDRRVSMAANWNRAANLVETPYFVLAHNDDVYEPAYLEEMLPLLADSPSAFAAHCRVQLIDDEGRLVHTPAERYKERLWPVGAPRARSVERELTCMRRGNIVVAPSVIFRTSAFKAIGPFNERYQFVTDWDYWLRGLFHGYSIVTSHRRLVRWRRHSRTATRAMEANLRRFREEIDLLGWIAVTAREKGLVGLSAPDYGLVMNTALSEFAARLSRAEYAEARRLHQFACSDIPGFRGSFRDIIMRLSFAGGRFGGTLLQTMESTYLAALQTFPRRTWASRGESR